MSFFGLFDIGGTSSADKALEQVAWPADLQANSSILTEDEKVLAQLLLQQQQHHLFVGWDRPGLNDEKKHHFFEQVMQLHKTYSGGLHSYLNKARVLLRDAAAGVNPLEGWSPQVPLGVSLVPGTPQFLEKERSGLEDLAFTGFVLVAGGLGERLGFHDIKVSLPTESTTCVCYLQLYCQQILSMQRKYGQGRRLPLAIMVSDDTSSKTQRLLVENNYFGLVEAQVTLLLQSKVAALSGNNANIALESAYQIDAKPHGHGDVHSLMHKSNTARKWAAAGVKWVVFFQDTNGLAFYTLPAMLGVSKELSLDVNSLAVPRSAKQAIGAITKLVHTDGREMTINVEYNQLDPLLRSTISPEGDVNEAATGKSAFPGNINQLVFGMETYIRTLAETEGVLGEFVNPKYADATKTKFQKPTRLECMMQDYPKALVGKASAKVGFTLAPSWICFSPCKNNASDAAKAAASGIPPASAWSAESDQYYCVTEMLRLLGVRAAKGASVSFGGITACSGPRIIIKPQSAIFMSELAHIFPFPSSISISHRSTLVVEGDVVVEKLQLDGALIVDASRGSRILVRAKVLLHESNILRTHPQTRLVRVLT